MIEISLLHSSLTNKSRFLLISLVMDTILGETTAYGRRQKLEAITEDLDLKDVYGATLQRIKEQGGEKARLGMRALMWISHSERLLQLDELFHALAVEIGSTDLNAKRIPSVETLLRCCLGLLVIDREVSTVRLIHFTLQEYLYTCPDLFGATHSAMAEICLTYLNFQTIKEIPPTLLALPQSAPFLKYSSLYWGAHARREVSRDVVSLALKLLGQIESHISTKLLLVDLIPMTGRYNRDIPIHGPLIGFTGLHCASVFGIVEIVTSFIGQPNPDLNKRDFLGITPLIWAAICGQEKVANSVRNGPGPRQGPAGGLPRAPDGTGRQNAVHTRPSNLRTAVLMEDGGPCKVRHFSVGDCRGLPGTTGDCGGLPGTAGDCGGLPGTTGDCRGLRGTMNPINSISRHPPRLNTEIHLITLKET